MKVFAALAFFILVVGIILGFIGLFMSQPWLLWPGVILFFAGVGLWLILELIERR
jgi:hypothetical protein